MSRIIKRILFLLVALAIVGYFVNRFWRVKGGPGGGVIEQQLRD